MRTLILPLTMLFIFVLLPVSAQQGDDEDAYMLQQQLALDHGNPSEQIKSAFAFGYVTGVAETADVNAICLPASVRQGEIKEVVSHFLDQHPEKLHWTRLNATVAALLAAYPCTAKRADSH